MTNDSDSDDDDTPGNFAWTRETNLHLKIARIENDVQCHSQLLGHKDFYCNQNSQVSWIVIVLESQISRIAKNIQNI